MRIFVDELPKSCDECPCCSEQDFAICSEYCEVLNEYVSEMVESKQELKPKTCPLQSLADYTKQVRKEVCEEIAQKMANKLVRMQPDGEFGTRLAIDWYDVNKVLDQIQENRQ